jgi:ADP-ribose pyrophosphatase YjhB (NUDIX family)
LLKIGLIKKTNERYSLTIQGLSYIDQIDSEKKTVSAQPKIITMLLVQNSEGDVLLQKREEQPYINSWTLPYGKLHIEDKSLSDAASREAWEKLGLSNQPVTHVGDCYIRVNARSETISTTLAHIFRFNRDNIGVNENLIWARPHKLADYKLAPAMQEIVARSFFGDTFFFEEFEVEWN